MNILFEIPGMYQASQDGIEVLIDAFLVDDGARSSVVVTLYQLENLGVIGKANPLAGIGLMIGRDGDGVLLATAETNHRGQAIFRNLPKGRYVLC